MPRSTTPILLAAALMEGPLVHAYDWSLRGYAEIRLYDYVGAETEPWEIGVKARPRVRLDFPEGGGIVFEPEVRHGWGRAGERFDEPEDSFGIERLYADFDFQSADVLLGKQAVNWGSGILFNPTDVFDDVFLRDVWAENTGYTALRVTVPLGATREVVSLLASDDRFREALGAVRGRATLGTTEIAVVASRDPFRRLDLVGLDVKGEATVGLWLEAASFNPWEGDSYVTAIAGVDYSFPVRDVMYLAIQYYRDESGSSRPEEYDLASYVRGERKTLGRDYATLTGRLAWSQDLTLGTLTVANLNDRSILVTAYGETTRIKNISISIGTTMLLGDEGEFNPPEELDPQGLLPDAIAYAWMRYHF